MYQDDPELIFGANEYWLGFYWKDYECAYLWCNLT